METKKKRILITAYDFYPNTGGVASYSKALALHLANLDYEVLVITKDRGQKLKESLPFRIQYISLPDSGLTSLPSFSLQLRKTLKTFRPDKVINTLWMPGGVATALALQFMKLKIDFYIVVHAMEVIESRKDWKKRLRRRLQFLKRWTFKKATKVFCISQYTKTLTQERTQCDPDKIEVIHNGVNPERFSPAEENEKLTAQWSGKSPLILSLSRLVPHKGIDKTLEALPQVLEKFPKLHYLIGGTGPDRKRLEEKVSELRLQDHVTFLGRVPDDYLPHYYSLADLFLLLSREELPHVEGFGLVILEAAACKTPSLGGMSGGIPDAIVEGKTGWLVDPLDSGAIAQKLQTILEEPEKVQQMGESAYNYTRLNRTWQQVSQKILQHMEIHG